MTETVEAPKRRRGSEYNRALREHGLTKRMAQTLNRLADQRSPVLLQLGDAMSAVGLQRKGLVTSSWDGRYGTQNVWMITWKGREVEAELGRAWIADITRQREEQAA